MTPSPPTAAQEQLSAHVCAALTGVEQAAHGHGWDAIPTLWALAATGPTDDPHAMVVPLPLFIDPDVWRAAPQQYMVLLALADQLRTDPRAAGVRVRAAMLAGCRLIGCAWLYEAWQVTTDLPTTPGVRAAAEDGDAAGVWAAAAQEDPGVAASLSMTTHRTLSTHPARRETRQVIALVPELPKELRWHWLVRERGGEVTVWAPRAGHTGESGNHHQALRVLAAQLRALNV